MIEWRPASTPPSTGEDVLVCTESKKGFRNVDKGYYTEGHWVHRGSAKVIAWAPINKPEEAVK